MNFVEYINNQQFAQNHVKLLRLLSRLIWLEKLDFYTLDLTQWMQPTLPRMRLKVEFGLGNENDVANLCSDPNLDAQKSEAYYIDKIRAGHKLLLGKLGNQIIFYLWLVTKQKNMMDKVLLLNPHEVAVERGFTRKEYRGQGLFAFGLSYLFPLLQAERATSCLTEIAPYNLPMVRTATKLGFSRMNSYYYWFRHPFHQHVFPRGPLANRFINK